MEQGIPEPIGSTNPKVALFMKAITQNYRSGELRLAEVPPPALQPRGVLVRTRVSLVSAGTEKLMIDLAQKNLVGKAKERPDLVKQVMEKARRDGVITTLEAVKRRLDAPIPLGYSAAGTVIATGSEVDRFQPGDRIGCAGAGYASHAEAIYVPQNLAVNLPDGVDFESAAFTTVGAIALQGLRLAELQLGETVAIIGLGLIGLLAVQLARASGCRVMGLDPDQSRCQLAKQLGCDEAVHQSSSFATLCHQVTNGHGIDKVIITASTKSSAPVKLAGEISRTRGIVVIVGAVGMQVPRQPFYDKELALRVSRSYGPGRYDSEYEEKGRDYPIGYVRWTENRNMQAFVQQLAAGHVDVKPLITHRFAIADALQAYDLVTGKSKEPFLGILLTYPEQPDLPRKISLTTNNHASRLTKTFTQANGKPIAQTVTVGLLGAGAFATGVLLPAMQKVKGIELVGLCTATGISAQHGATKFGFQYATTDENEIFSDPSISTVVITTRHHLHARQVIAALKAGKHVFVEKPLCLNEKELDEIVKTYRELELRSVGEKENGKAEEFPSLLLSPAPSCPDPVLMVGYNRRFAPLARQMKGFLLEIDEPLVMHYRINAGFIPLDHWTQDPEQGGGRILGEVCHFVDFLTYLAGSPPVEVHARTLPNNGKYRDDNVVITLTFQNGSLGTITYVANGDKAFPKERVEVFGGSAVAVLDNFRELELSKSGKRRVLKSRLTQDKGHRGEWEELVRCIDSGAVLPIPFYDMLAVSQATFEIMRSLKLKGESVIAGPSGLVEKSVEHSSATA